MDSRTLGSHLVFIRLAWTIGYNLFVPKELILTEVLEVNSSNRFAESIFACLSARRRK